MLSTDFVHGAPNWLDLGTPDIDGAAAFYGSLFGWRFVSSGPETGGYGTFQLDGRAVAGGMPVTAEQGPSAWTVYFRTVDADAIAKAVEQGGGSLALEPTDVMDLGRVAVAADPAGSSFGLWQPGRRQGLDAVGEDGTLHWLELYVPDLGAAKEFYGSVLGWNTFDVPFPGGSYTTLHPAGTDAEAMFGGMVPLRFDPVEAEAGPHWTPYLHVPDVDAVVARAGELGGTVRLAGTDLPDVGRIAKLTDPYGAGFAVMKAAPPQA